ncbi:hypothetical protein BDZ94DRAFT_1263100 [Collybia nuda]|uniref:Ricin B lectin domain-containing protein n=1 Tax=Collybia nuda TaxID=64659 RepID=A0A9P5Y5J0_9AGAR|nr:hypothetical protein BDZ94DRAFT_1263100 [Collybia nuda]
MSFTGDNIKNVRTKMFVDVYSGGFTPGTHIIMFALNKAPSGTANQQWRIVPVHHSERFDRSICRRRWCGRSWKGASH